MSTIEEQTEHREELTAFEEAAELAKRNRDRADDHRADLVNLARRRDQWAAYGDRHPTEPNPFGPHLEPFRYAKSGTELARQLQDNIDHVEQELAKLTATTEKLRPATLPRLVAHDLQKGTGYGTQTTSTHPPEAQAEPPRRHRPLVGSEATETRQVERELKAGAAVYSPPCLPRHEPPPPEISLPDPVSVRSDLRHGQAERFPLCCVLRYTLEAAITRGGSGQAVRRGVRYTPAGIEHVPCRIRHDATLTHRESEHLLNIRAMR